MKTIPLHHLCSKMIFKNREPPWGSELENKLITTIMEVFMYEEYFEKLKEECVIRNRTEGTYNNYALKVTQFMNWNKDKKPEDYTLLDARNYIYELRVDLKRSTQHCNGVNSALKFFYRYVLKKSWDQDVVPRMMNDFVSGKLFSIDLGN